MARWHFGPIFALALSGCAGATYGASTQGLIPPRPKGATYSNWEHLCITISTRNLTEALNQAGQEGWELVGVDAGGIACFKRPIPLTPAKKPAS